MNIITTLPQKIKITNNILYLKNNIITYRQKNKIKLNANYIFGNIMFEVNTRYSIKINNNFEYNNVFIKLDNKSNTIYVYNTYKDFIENNIVTIKHLYNDMIIKLNYNMDLYNLKGIKFLHINNKQYEIKSIISNKELLLKKI